MQQQFCKILKNYTKCIATQLLTGTVHVRFIHPLGWQPDLQPRLNCGRIFKRAAQFNCSNNSEVLPISSGSFSKGLAANSLESCCFKSRRSCCGDGPDGTAGNGVSAVAGELTSTDLPLMPNNCKFLEFV